MLRLAMLLPLCLGGGDPGWEESAPLTIPPASNTLSSNDSDQIIQVSEQGTHLTLITSESEDFTPGKLPDTTITALPEGLTVATRTLPQHHFCYLARFHGLPVPTECAIYPDTQLSALP